MNTNLEKARAKMLDEQKEIDRLNAMREKLIADWESKRINEAQYQQGLIQLNMQLSIASARLEKSQDEVRNIEHGADQAANNPILQNTPTPTPAQQPEPAPTPTPAPAQQPTPAPTPTANPTQSPAAPTVDPTQPPASPDSTGETGSASENPIFDALSEKIEREQKELEYLNSVRKEIRDNERNMSQIEYQKEIKDIERHLALAQEKLENSRNTAKNYDLAYHLLKDLDRIYNQQDTIRDEIDRREMNKEVDAKRKELSTSMHALPDDLAEELRQRFISERNNANQAPKKPTLQNTPTPTPAPTPTANSTQSPAAPTPTPAPAQQPTPAPTALVPVNGVKKTTQNPGTQNKAPTPPTALVPVNGVKKTTQNPGTQNKAPTPPTAKPTGANANKEPEERGLYTILADLTRGIDVKKGDARKYRASNIRVAKDFKDELKSGNYIYNIVHFVPALIKIPVNIVRKFISRFTTSLRDRERIDELKNRIDKLSDADLRVIWREYRGSRVLGERNPTILNTLLNERMQRYAMDHVTKLNSVMENKYQQLFETSLVVDDCDRIINDKNSSADEKKAAQERRAKVLKGKADMIKGLREDYVQANHWLSGGAHGFEEDMKASASKLSIVGKRFAKDHDLNQELAEIQAEIEQREKKAIASHDDAAALRAFIDNETLLIENTKIQSGILGERSIGEKYYSPLAEKLDYRNDPFVRDLFTTIAVTAATVSAVSAIDVHSRQADQFVGDHNTSSSELEGEIHDYGETLKGHSDDYMEGMQAQANGNIVNNANTIERRTLDESGWTIGSGNYRHLDSANHELYNSAADTAKSQLDEIASKCGSGTITNQEALDLVSNVANETHRTLLDTYNSYLPILQNYAATHPQFDLHGVTEAMEQVALHPDAIVKMNEGMVESVQIGEELLKLNFDSINSLPSDMRQTLFGDITAAAALTYNVHKAMDEKAKAGKYGNSVTKMAADYISFKNGANANSNGNTQHEGRTR